MTSFGGFTYHIMFGDLTVFAVLNNYAVHPKHNSKSFAEDALVILRLLKTAQILSGPPFWPIKRSNKLISA